MEDTFKNIFEIGSVILFLFGIVLLIVNLVYSKSFKQFTIGFLVGFGSLILGVIGITLSPTKYKSNTVYTYIGRNMEDYRLDTIYSKQVIDINRYELVWVNMDSLWVDNDDPYSTRYLIIRQIAPQ